VQPEQIAKIIADLRRRVNAENAPSALYEKKKRARCDHHRARF